MIETAPACDYCIDSLAQLVGIGDIGGDEQDLSIATRACHDLVCRGFSASPIPSDDRNAGAVSDEETGTSQADAGSATSDQDYLAIHSATVALIGVTVVQRDFVRQSEVLFGDMLSRHRRHGPRCLDDLLADPGHKRPHLMGLPVMIDTSALS
jgi:hypothetical protein